MATAYTQLARLKEALKRRLPPFADLLREHHVPAVVPGSEPMSDPRTG